MTEPTIAEVLAQYPDETDFISADGNKWKRECYTGVQMICCDYLGLNITETSWKSICIKGLRPKPQKRRVTVDGFIPMFKDFECGYSFYIRKPDHRNVKPATLTYETEEPEPIKLKTRSEMAAEDLERMHRGIR